MSLDTRWPRQAIGELVVGGDISYGVVQPGQSVSDGVPIVRVKDLANGQIDRREPMRVVQKIAAQHGRTALIGGELLVTVVGSVGETAVVPPELAGWNVARAIAVLRPSDVSARWLGYCIQSPEVRAEFDSMLNTTVQATLNLGDLKRLQVPVPPAHHRTAILELLGALDDKISVNTTLISLADDLAEQKFLAMSIQDGVSRPLSSLAQFVNGKAFTKDATGTGRVVIRIAELNSGLGKSTVYNDLDVAEKYLARPGDLLFAWSGSLTVQRWFREEGIVNQHIFKVIPVDVPLWVVNGALRTKLAEFMGIAADKATTMGHIQRHHLDESVLVPDDEAIACADAAMQALWDRALQAETESLKLAELRDTLLPELMSGRLRVQDAERLVEGEVQ